MKGRERRSLQLVAQPPLLTPTTQQLQQINFKRSKKEDIFPPSEAPPSRVRNNQKVIVCLQLINLAENTAGKVIQKYTSEAFLY